MGLIKNKASTVTGENRLLLVANSRDIPQHGVDRTQYYDTDTVESVQN